MGASDQLANRTSDQSGKVKAIIFAWIGQSYQKESAD